jgi:hypothetical protein
MSSDATIADIKIDFPLKDQQIKQPSRKDQVIFELELKANINSVKR